MNSRKDYLIELETKTIKDYINIIRSHLLIVILISSSIFAASIFYAISATNIYKAITILKISPPEGNILEAPLLTQIGDTRSDRFIANEIETMRNITIREQVANKIVESYTTLDQKDRFSIILEDDKYFEDKREKIKSPGSIALMLNLGVEINQKEGLDFIEIIAESPSPYEAALIVNTYANVYRSFNLLDNRKQVSAVKEFLKIQKDEKYDELLQVENKYKEYQLKGKALVLDEQATSLIHSIATLEAEKNAVAVEMSITKKALNQYTEELERKDLSVSKYLESKSGEPYLEILQRQIAQLEAQRDIAIANSANKEDSNPVLRDKIDNDIKNLKIKLKEKMEEYRATILASSPEEIRGLSQQIFEEDVKYKSLSTSYEQLNNQIKTYERKFDNLPKASIGLARIERERVSSERLYVLLEEKYQEALLNEQAITGNVLVLSHAREPQTPSKPNRKNIIIAGIFFGLVLGVGYALLLTYFDKTVKTPEDIEKLDIKLLGWIPQIEEFGTNGSFSEFFIANNSNTISSDSFKFLRTTMNYSQTEGSAKVLLVTSSAPSEGKSVISSNLAGSYAIAKKKTLIIDCDLRKPRTHTIFNKKRVPGLVDYLYGKATYEDIISLTDVKGLSLIPVGTIPQNPTEFLDSSGMKSFLNRARQEYEIIIIDSPPLTTLADAIILSRLVDETIVVATSGVTDTELLQKSVEQLKRLEGSTFKGVLLNKFNLKKNYGSYYYKYASHYAREAKPSRGKKRRA